MSAHAKFSPSSFERWEACPASIKMSEGIERKDSPAALEGVKAHGGLEVVLKNGEAKLRESALFLTRSHFTPEMRQHVVETAEWIWHQANGLPLSSEKKVYLSHIDQHLWGTLDCSIHEDFGTLHIIDFKYGKHVPVDVKENGQLLVYAVGEAFAHKYNFEAVKLTIIQPRATHADGPVRSWTTPIETIFETEERLRQAIARVKGPKPEIKAGEHCFFCDAKKICPAYTPEATKRTKAGFANQWNLKSKMSDSEIMKWFETPKSRDDEKN